MSALVYGDITIGEQLYRETAHPSAAASGDISIRVLLYMETAQSECSCIWRHHNQSAAVYGDITIRVQLYRDITTRVVLHIETLSFVRMGTAGVWQKLDPGHKGRLVLNK